MNFNLMGYRRPALLLSLVLVVLSLGLLLFRGLNLGIDFTGGNVIQVEFGNRPDVAEVREVVSAVVAKGAMIQNFGEAGIIIRTNEDTEGSREQVVKVLQEKLYTFFQIPEFLPFSLTVNFQLFVVLLIILYDVFPTFPKFDARQ